MKKEKLYLMLGWILAFLSIIFMPLICVLGVLVLAFLSWKNGARIHALILSALFFSSLGIAMEKILSLFFRAILEVMTIMY